MTDQITPKQFHEAEGVADWRVVGDGANGSYEKVVPKVVAQAGFEPAFWP
jgi:hypothetical protein